MLCGSMHLRVKRRTFANDSYTIKIYFMTKELFCSLKIFCFLFPPQRDYYTRLLKKWVFIANEEIDAVGCKLNI